MSEIEMIDRKIATLRQQSLEKQEKLLLLRNYHYDINHAEIDLLERTIKSLQGSIADFTRKKKHINPIFTFKIKL